MEYKLTTYKELEWYIINETEKESLLFLKDSFTNEQIIKYFDKYDNYFNVQFNPNNTKIWWNESYVQEVLNTNFLSDLDIKDLNKMKTILELNGERRIVEDYVRLLTYEEAKDLPLEIRKTKRDWGYWTMSPCDFYSSGSASVFSVGGSGYPGSLDYYYVRNTYAVRPVISLKSNNLISTNTLDSPLITNQLSREEIIKRLKKAKNI